MIKLFSILVIIFILASCGPRRMQCGPKRRCVQLIEEKKASEKETLKTAFYHV